MRKIIMCLCSVLVLSILACACCNRAFGQEGEEVLKEQKMPDLASPSSGAILTRLPNGLLVYIFKDKRFPLVCTRLYVRVGSVDESPEQAGISHVLEHMVFKGTDHRAKGAIAREVESKGGYLNAATSFDKTWYLTDMPALHWRTGMEVVRDMAFHATLDAAELEAEKDVIVSELQRGEDSPMRKLYESLQTASLKNTPYGRPIIGFEKTIRSLTVDDLKNYVSKWYQPQNMMLLVGGDIEPAEVFAHAQKLFGEFANHSDLPLREPFNPNTASFGSPVVEVIRGPWNRVYMGLAMPAPPLRDLRSIDLDVLCFLLGGDGTSAFYRQFKYEDQLVEGIDVDNSSLGRAGFITITARAEPEKVEKFWNGLTKALASLSAKNFDLAAITRAKFNLEDSMDRAGETLNGLVRFRGAIQFDLGGDIGEDNIRFAQKNVNESQLESAIKTWFNPEYARIRVLAPHDAKLPDFEKIMRSNWPGAEVKSVEAGVNKTVSMEREDIDLGDNRKLILLPDRHAPYVAIKLLMPGGNALLAPSQQGLANLAAAVLTDGAGDYSKPALERWMSEKAAAITAHAGLQTFGISITGPARFNADYFTMLRDLLRRPKFATDEFKREQDNLVAALIRRNDQPLSYMFAKVNPFLFPGGQLYGYDLLGTVENLRSFNVINVRDFWTIQGAMPWTLAIAGDFDRDNILELVRGLPVPHVDVPLIKAPEWGHDKNLALTLPERNQAHLLQIYPTVDPLNHDAPALILLASVLDGQSGILFTELRDRDGLGYTVTAINRTMPLTGYMAFYIGTIPDKIKAARDGFTTIVERLKREPLDKSLLVAASNTLLGEYLRSRQSLDARASEAALNSIMRYPVNFQQEQIDRASAITPAQLQDIARKYLNNPYDVSLMP